MLLRSHDAEVFKATGNLFLPGFIVAVAAEESSFDKVWFIKINDIDIVNDLFLIRNSYGNWAVAGHHYLKEYFFLEKDYMVKNGYIYRVDKKHFTIFFKESNSVSLC